METSSTLQLGGPTEIIIVIVESPEENQVTSLLGDMDPCVTCKKEVESDHQSMECDFCEEWEHMECVKERDRPTEELYQALVRCRGSKVIQYVCSRCRKKGSVSKIMLEKDYELARVSDELARATDAKLASARQLELKENELGDMRSELKRLRDEMKTNL